MSMKRLLAYTAVALLMGGCAVTKGTEGTKMKKTPIQEKTALKGRMEIRLSADKLYAGFDARRVAFTDGGKALRLHPYVFKRCKEFTGWVITDPIDLLPVENGIGRKGKVERVLLRVKADTPEGTRIEAWVRTGNNPLDHGGWTSWQKVRDPKESRYSATGRYIEVKVLLRSDKKDVSPSLRGVDITSTYTLEPRWSHPAELDGKKSHIIHIMRSPIEFHYESPLHPVLVEFRKKAKLDEVIKGAKSDYERMVKLQDWIASTHNDRHRGWYKGHYPWDIRKVFRIENGKRTIYGHCMSYAEVMVDACTALGYRARHMAVLGFREMSHEVVEVWLPDMQKWVFFDPSLANNYYDLKTKEPLNVIEIHDIIKNTFLRKGEDMNWFSSRRSKATRARVRQLGGKKHIGCRLGGWMYGKKMPANYDWGWQHGWLAQGFVQMTPRNDFYSHPEAVSKHFSYYPGYDGYPFWVDEKTPPRKGVTDWFTRKRDFYWGVDQASMCLLEGEKEGEIVVKMGNSMPFFVGYRITVDGKAVKDLLKTDTFRWNLSGKVSSLTVVPVDAFGREGTGSTAVVVRE